jgi:homoserine dehydrogenase
MTKHHLALLGFGNVGQALARLLLRKQDELQQDYAVSFAVTGIGTGRHGRAVNPNGLDLQAALDLVASGGSLDSLSTQPVRDAEDFIGASQAHILFENTPVSYADGQPAIHHLETALDLGMHAVTANKGPVVHAHAALKDRAAKNGVEFYYESAVMDGAPIFSLFRDALPGAALTGFKGILNSTTNLILTLMESGKSFDEALANAQAIGVAETDPSGDIDGWDAAIKVAALATVLMGVPTTPDQVDRTGIGAITSADIAAAQADGKRWKLVCSAQKQGDTVVSSVRPEQVAPDSALFGVGGTGAIVQFESDVLGMLSIREDQSQKVTSPDATAYGLLADFLNAVR